MPKSGKYCKRLVMSGELPFSKNDSGIQRYGLRFDHSFHVPCLFYVLHHRCCLHTAAIFVGYRRFMTRSSFAFGSYSETCTNADDGCFGRWARPLARLILFAREWSSNTKAFDGSRLRSGFGSSREKTKSKDRVKIERLRCISSARPRCFCIDIAHTRTIHDILLSILSQTVFPIGLKPRSDHTFYLIAMSYRLYHLVATVLLFIPEFPQFG